tara:strand:- start:222 stop:374 length:153 start_codon:yes stop_codon:yes gene_type:complete
MNIATFLLGFMGGVIGGLLVVDTVNHLRHRNVNSSRILDEIAFIDDIEFQ